MRHLLQCDILTNNKVSFDILHATLEYMRHCLLRRSSIAPFFQAKTRMPYPGSGKCQFKIFIKNWIMMHRVLVLYSLPEDLILGPEFLQQHLLSIDWDHQHLPWGCGQQPDPLEDTSAKQRAQPQLWLSLFQLGRHHVLGHWQVFSEQLLLWVGEPGSRGWPHSLSMRGSGFHHHRCLVWLGRHNLWSHLRQWGTHHQELGSDKLQPRSHPDPLPKMPKPRGSQWLSRLGGPCCQPQQILGRARPQNQPQILFKLLLWWAPSLQLLGRQLLLLLWAPRSRTHGLVRYHFLTLVHVDMGHHRNFHWGLSHPSSVQPRVWALQRHSAHRVWPSHPREHRARLWSILRTITTPDLPISQKSPG